MSVHSFPAASTYIAHISDNSNAGTVLREKRKRRYKQKKFIQKKVTEDRIGIGKR